MNSRKDTESLAEKYVKKGKFDEAIKEYRKLLVDGEEGIPIRNIISDLYVKTGQEEKAAREFRQIAHYYEEKKIFAKAIALYKRCTRLDPDDHASAEKMAGLLSLQGYISEAKDEYKRLAKKYASSHQNQDAIRMYRFLIDLDHQDTESRLVLVDLFEAEDQTGQAVEELNALAELMAFKERLEEAGELLDRARNMDSENPRTLFNLVDILKKKKKDEEALSLVKIILEKEKHNIKALKIYGNLLLRLNDYKKAEDIFSEILEDNPNDASTRIRLGTIYIYEKKHNEAFALFEPLVDSFLKQKKEDKAISLLGLILRGKIIHGPTLEKIASIYEIKNQYEKLKVVYKILLNQYKKENRQEAAIEVIRRMVKVFPEEEAYYREYKRMRKLLGIDEDEEEDTESLFQQKDAKMTLEESLSQADVYIEQGLIRIAKRFLENLKLDFPGDSRIEQKLESIKETSPDADRNEISEKVEKITGKETEAEEKIAPKKEAETELEKDREEEKITEAAQEEGPDVREAPGAKESTQAREDEVEEEPISVAHIFADTDLIPFFSPEDETVDFFDLAERINEELAAIEDVMFLQKERISSTSEKPLQEIIKEFKKDLSERMHEASNESRYNLGIAYMEQGLWDEAIEEFKLAARESFLTVDCFLSVSLCNQNKKEYEEAVKWIQKALDVSEKDSNQFYSLKYELASLFEAMGEFLKSMQTFIEVKEWKSDFRDVSKRLKGVASKIK